MDVFFFLQNRAKRPVDENGIFELNSEKEVFNFWRSLGKVLDTSKNN